MSELRITCTADRDDDLRAYSFGPGTLIIEVLSPENRESCYLHEAEVRELFNWLGVWLHGGNRD